MKLITGDIPKDVQPPDTSCFSSLVFLASEPQVSVLSQAQRKESSQPTMDLRSRELSQPYVFEGALAECFATARGD